MQTCLSKPHLDVALEVFSIQPFPFNIVREILDKH